MIKCPACGTENAAGSNFCIACGIDFNATATDQQVRTDSVAPPSPNTPPLTSPSVDMPREYLDAPPPPPPPKPYSSPPMDTPPSQPSYTSPSIAPTSRPSKDRTLALVLEIVGGLLGLPGIGWLYSGQIVPGLIILGTMLGINVVGLVIAVFTGGLSCCCSVPLNLAVAGVSTYLLHNHTKQNPETFGA